MVSDKGEEEVLWIRNHIVNDKVHIICTLFVKQTNKHIHTFIIELTITVVSGVVGSVPDVVPPVV